MNLYAKFCKTENLRLAFFVIKSNTFTTALIFSFSFRKNVLHVCHNGKHRRLWPFAEYSDESQVEILYSDVADITDLETLRAAF